MNSSRAFRHQSSPRDRNGFREATVPLTAGRSELLVGGNDERFRGLVHDLLAFGGRLRDIRDALGDLIGLTGPAYTVMIAIAHLAGDNHANRIQDTGEFNDTGSIEVVHTEVNVMSVARHLNVSQPFVTAEVRKLASAGLVDKVASRSDRRSVSLTVTDRARDLLAELAPHQRDINDTLFASLDQTDFERLASIMSHLVTDADRALTFAADRSSTRRQGGAA